MYSVIKENEDKIVLNFI